MIVPPQYSALDGHRRAEFFMLRQAVPTGPVIGFYSGALIHQSIADEWGRRYTFVGIATFRRRGVYDCDALKTAEFILAPGLIYRLDRMPPTFWELLYRVFYGKRQGLRS
jgi:hypothetical protein